MVGDDDFGTSPQWNACEVATIGAFTSWEIWDEPPWLTPAIPLANSSSCCASKGKQGSGVAAPGAGVVKKLLNAAWTGRCTGGGSVPLLPDLSDTESWSDS